jgi:serine protease inhibitor
MHAIIARPAALLVLVLTSLGACSSSTGPREPGEPLTELPRALSADEREVIRASNRFAFDILRETVVEEAASGGPSPNVFLSPLSASMALGMTMNGARGETLDGMRSALGFGAMGLESINASYRDVIDLLLGLDESVDMRIANSIWAKEGFPFHDAFFETARTYFDAEVGSLDFGSPTAAPTINDWVKEKTGDRIETIVPDPIPADIVMYLINAIYFKGDWREQFDRAQTRDQTFTRADGSTRTVPMMNRLGTMRFNRTEDVSVVELAYGREAYAMTVVLPHEETELDALVASLDGERWDGWIEGLAEQRISLGLPRFRLEYETTMNEPLIRLGMERAFEEGNADFTGMSPVGEDLFISSVVQKTFIDVNEEGTEAAAATSVGIGVVSAPPSVIVDRPFIVAIRERLSGTIVFLGVIGDPGA